MNRSGEGLEKTSVSKQEVQELAAKINCPILLARVLLGRGLEKPDAARRFIDPQFSDLSSCYSPPGIETVARLIDEAGQLEILIETSSPRSALLGQVLKQGLKIINIDTEFQYFSGQPVSEKKKELTILLSDSNIDFSRWNGGILVVPGSENQSPAQPENLYTFGNHQSRPELICYLVEIMLRKYYRLEKPDFVALDLETTGKTPRNSEIIEIGALKFKKGVCVDKFESFVASTDNVPGIITDITGIENCDLKNAPSPRRALQDFVEFVGDYKLVAHNAGFDISFLRYHGKKYLGERLQFEYEDTLRLAQSSLPGLPGFSLDVVADHLDIKLGTHHRALSDARVSGKIYLRLFERKTDIIRRNMEELFIPASLALAAGSEISNFQSRVLYRLGVKKFWESKKALCTFYQKNSSLASSRVWFPQQLIKIIKNSDAPLIQQLFEAKKMDEIRELVEQLTSDLPPGNNDRLIFNPEWIEICDGCIRDSELTIKTFRLLEKTAPWSSRTQPPCFLLDDCHIINISEYDGNKICVVKRNGKWFRARLPANWPSENELKVSSPVGLYIVPSLRLRYGRPVMSFFIIGKKIEH
ncbi:MAG: exonuclease domain-containing protein [bacterium]